MCTNSQMAWKGDYAAALQVDHSSQVTAQSESCQKLEQAYNATRRDAGKREARKNWGRIQLLRKHSLNTQ